jgi:L-ascorbate metabolism protein UlaG (beta-lactamase superfamily)
MTPISLRATYVGGPTALIEFCGLRLLTDPTFDPAGSSYPTPVYTLHKTMNPALTAADVGEIDAVLLSHDHHFDNLDRAGRAMLPRARRVIAPAAGAERLGHGVTSLGAWESLTLDSSDGRCARVTGVPARHGPASGDRGPCIGFLLQDAAQPADASTPAIYISGDTVWYETLNAIPRQGDVRVAFLFMGAARVLEVGPAHLTMTGEEGVLAANAMPHAAIVPLHYEGWAHLSEGRTQIEQAYAAAGMSDRLRWLPAGRAVSLGEVVR